MVMDISSLNFDELQKKIMQARKKHFPDDPTHLAFFNEKVILMDIGNNPKVISTTKLHSVGAFK